MHTRKLGPFDVSALGIGCMSLSHAYGTPPPADAAAAVLHAALDAGYTHVDTAALYGFGANETLIGDTLSSRRREFVLASKCGMFRNAQGQREIDGRPEAITRTCDDSLSRLKTDVIDLYYLHRWDKKVPVEESIGAMARLVEAGKVRAIGMSEVSAATIRRAHAVHPLAAVQTEYSLWTRNAEVAVLDTCRELGIAFVAFSPLARGFLTGELRDVVGAAAEGHPPRDAPLPGRPLGEEPAACSTASRRWPASRAARWASWRWPGCWRGRRTSSRFPARRASTTCARTWARSTSRLAPEIASRLDGLINPRTVSGPRYNAATLPEIDTEDVPAETAGT